MARPVDPRLWAHSRSARPYLVLSVLTSLVITACVVVSALAIARVLAGVITDPARRTLGAWSGTLTVLALAVLVRGLATWWQARLAHRAGAAVVAELETAVLAAGANLSPRELDSGRAELAVLVTSGLAGLRAYLAGYLPALLLAAAAPPIVLLVIAVHDPQSGLIIALTLPLIPVFMILIGLVTQGKSAATLTATTRLTDQVLDLFAGMPTLRALGRETGPAGPTMRGRVRTLSDSLHQRTMSALRTAFLSAAALELLATLSVALVAVSIGMRLVFGHVPLYPGLVALILAPEVYLPLRLLGERFHAAQDGMAAAERAFAVLEPDVAPARSQARSGAARSADPEQRWASSTVQAVESGAASGASPTVARSSAETESPEPAPQSAVAIRRAAVPRDPGADDIRVVGLTVLGRGGAAPAGLTAEFVAGQLTVLAGPNGCGKSTALLAILGLIAADAGTVTVGGAPVAGEPWWWDRVAWLPQRPVLLPGTLRANLELFGVRSGSALDTACAATGFDAVLRSLPDGWDTVVGPGGHGLSLGERQRLALTRVLAADRPVLLLDEPTAHLDEAAEATVLDALAERAHAGAVVVVVGHRPSVLARADRIVTVAGNGPAAVDAGRPAPASAGYLAETGHTGPVSPGSVPVPPAESGSGAVDPVIARVGDRPSGQLVPAGSGSSDTDPAGVRLGQGDFSRPAGADSARSIDAESVVGRRPDRTFPTGPISPHPDDSDAAVGRRPNHARTSAGGSAARSGPDSLLGGANSGSGGVAEAADPSTPAAALSTTAGLRGDGVVRQSAEGAARSNRSGAWDELRELSRLLRVPRWRAVASVGWGTLALGSGLALAAVAAWLIARAWEMPPVLYLSVAAVSVRALGISRAVCRYVERLATHDVALRAMTSARVAVYSVLADMGFRSLRRAAGEPADPAQPAALRRGDLLTRIGTDIDDLGAVVVRALVPVAVAAVLAVAAVGVLAAVSIPAAGALALALLVAGAVAPWLSARSARAAESARHADRVEFAAESLTVLDHAPELRVAGRLDAALDTARSAAGRAVAAEDRVARPGAWAAAALPVSIGAAVLAALIAGILLYGSRTGMVSPDLPGVVPGGITPMALAVLVLVPLSAFEAVAALPAAAQSLSRGRAAVRRFTTFRAGAVVARQNGGTPRRDARASDAASLDSQVPMRPGQFSRCRTEAPGSTAVPQDSLPASCAVPMPAGHRIAVVGPSGAGKTTLLTEWAGLAGIPRPNTTFFAEDAHLFGTSVLENLRVAKPELTDAEAEAALRAVGAGPWLDSLADGVRTELTGGAAAVSGGQRRRILLARALVAPARVVLLDEPTEHLEAAAGAELLRALLDRDSGLIDPDRIVVVVTHQLPADHRADVIVTVAGGGRVSVDPVTSECAGRENPLPVR